MRAIGYWMERGISPEYLLSRSRDEMIIFAAIAELNDDDRVNMIKQILGKICGRR